MYAAENKTEAFKGIISKGIRMLLFMGIPAVVFLAAYGRPVIRLLFERNAFTSQDTAYVYYAFAIFLFSLPASMLGAVISQGFYALKRTTIISLISILLTVFYVVLCVIFIKPFGYLAIPLAFVLYHNTAVIITSLVLGNSLGKTGWLPMLPSALKNLALSALTALAVYPLMLYLSKNSFLSSAVCAASFVFYFIVSRYVLKSEEACLIQQTFSDRFIKAFIF
jgi:putative peptidoglycan lipid II flippase